MISVQQSLVSLQGSSVAVKIPCPQIVLLHGLDPAWHWPLKQVSVPLQKSPSPQEDPLESGAVQLSEVSLQDSEQFASPSGPGHGFPAWTLQKPPLHVSVPLQNSPSSQAALLLMLVQQPLLQVSVVQGLPSLQSLLPTQSGAFTQQPFVHVSAVQVFLPRSSLLRTDGALHVDAFPSTVRACPGLELGDLVALPAGPRGLVHAVRLGDRHDTRCEAGPALVATSAAHELQRGDGVDMPIWRALQNTRSRDWSSSQRRWWSHHCRAGGSPVAHWTVVLAAPAIIARSARHPNARRRPLEAERACL